jgi:hypothetical protein
MCEDLRHDVERYASLHKIARRTVSEVMKFQAVIETRPFYRLLPRSSVVIPWIAASTGKEIAILAGLRQFTGNMKCLSY